MRRVLAWFVLLSPWSPSTLREAAGGPWQSGGVYDIGRTAEEESHD
jgi:hypothetical protein